MTYLVMALAGATIFAVLAIAYAALRWAAHMRQTELRARRSEAVRTARRLAPVCEMELKAECRVRPYIVDRLAAELESRGYENADELAGEAVGAMLAERM